MFRPNVTDIQQEDRTNHYSDSKFLSPKMHAGKPLGFKSVVPVKPLMNLTIWRLRFCLLSLIICQLKNTRVNETILIKLIGTLLKAMHLFVDYKPKDLSTSQYHHPKNTKPTNLSTSLPPPQKNWTLNVSNLLGSWTFSRKVKIKKSSPESSLTSPFRDQSSPANSTGWRKATSRKAASHWTEMLLQKIQQVFERGVEIVWKLLKSVKWITQLLQYNISKG